MNIIASRYEITNKLYTYTAAMSKGKWMVSRLKKGDPNIPPMRQIFTHNGWQPSINPTDKFCEFPALEEVLELIGHEYEAVA